MELPGGHAVGHAYAASRQATRFTVLFTIPRGPFQDNPVPVRSNGARGGGPSLHHEGMQGFTCGRDVLLVAGATSRASGYRQGAGGCPFSKEKAYGQRTKAGVTAWEIPRLQRAKPTRRRLVTRNKRPPARR